MRLKNIPFLLIILMAFYSCTEVKSHYDQITVLKTEKEYVSSINQSFDEIREKENNEFLIGEEYDLLKYEYSIGSNEDTYQVTYRFDKKGCNEVGIDAYIDGVDDANKVVAGFKKYFTENKEFRETGNDNDLLRWETLDGSIGTELDYSNAARGRVALTIFAYE